MHKRGQIRLRLGKREEKENVQKTSLEKIQGTGGVPLEEGSEGTLAVTAH